MITNDAYKINIGAPTENTVLIKSNRSPIGILYKVTSNHWNEIHPDDYDASSNYGNGITRVESGTNSGRFVTQYAAGSATNFFITTGAVDSITGITASDLESEYTSFEAVPQSNVNKVYKGSNLIWYDKNSYVYVSGATRVSGQGGGVPTFGTNTDIKSFSLIGDRFTTLPDQALEGCLGLKTANLGNSITSIGEKAFKNCDGLEKINIPRSVNEIKKEAFASSSLEKIDLSNITDIGSGAFQFTELSSIRLSSGLNTLGDHAFSGCTGLEVIRMMSDNPPTHDPLFPAFSGVNANAKVYVKLSASGNWGSTFGGLDVEPIIVQDTFQLTLSEAPSTTDTFAFTFNQIASGSLGYKWESDESAAGEANKYTCEKQSANVEGTTANTWRIEQSSYLNPRYLVDPRSASANAATPFDVASGDWMRGEEDGAGGITYLESGITLNFQNVAYSDSVATGILTN